MTKRQAFLIWMAAVAALPAGCTSGDSTRTVVTAANDRPVNRLPDFEGPEELETALASFGKCVERSFPIVMRFRTSPFIGLTTEIGSQHKEDGDRVDAVAANCERQLDLDRRLSAYQVQHRPTTSVERKLAEEFVKCASAVSPEMSDRVSKADLDSQDAVSSFMSVLHPSTTSLTGDELIAIGECDSQLTGPEHVFSDGHPWFTR